MNYYEGIYILDPTLSDDKLKELADSLISELAQKGEVFAVEKIGKRPLAYQVKKMTEGYYMVVYFSSDPVEIPRLHGKYSLNASIIRVMILRRKEEEVRKIKESLGAKAESKEETVTVVSTESASWDVPDENWKEKQNFTQLPDENSEESDENSEEV